MHLVALDTETCALGSGRDRVVQFCAVELDEDLNILSEWTELVHPGRRIPAAATAVHGITDEMVYGKPPFAHFAPRLRARFHPDTVFIAYNAAFDFGVLNGEFARCGVPVLPAHLDEVVDWPGQAIRPTRRSHLYKDEAGVVRLGFAKHQGKPALDVPDYLAWMLEEDFPERTKSQVRRVLNERVLAV